jgi:hypothetical protein
LADAVVSLEKGKNVPTVKTERKAEGGVVSFRCHTHIRGGNFHAMPFAARSVSLFLLNLRFACFGVTFLGASGFAAGAGSADPAKETKRKASEMTEKFSWSEMLPTAWQKNPRLFFMVATDVSEAGKKLPPVSTEHPAYFELKTAGYREIGDTAAGEKTLKPEQIEPTLLKALASGGYHPAKEGQAPSLLIVYRWGVHSPLDPDALDGNARILNQLDRAAMIGGEKFAAELMEAYRERATFAAISRGMPPEMREFADPVNILKMRDQKTYLMVEGTGDDIYYIVASAYDHASMKAGRPVHLWRTRVTVPSNGVTQEITLPTMLVTAGPFFGKETDRAEIISRRTVPEGSVEIGTATVVEPAAPSAPAGKAK